MISSRTILVAAAAMLTLTTLDAGNEAGARVNGYHAYCQWHKQQAMNTGKEEWWDRWRACIRGDFWTADERGYDTGQRPGRRGRGGLFSPPAPAGE